MRMTYDDDFLRWVEILTGTLPARVRDAVKHVESWGMHHVDAELLTHQSLDNAVATTWLSEAVLELQHKGIPESKLLAKLRNDIEIWPTWAELRAAVLLLRVTGNNSLFQLEADKRTGKHADFRVVVQGESTPLDIEFKALGLSDEETNFCRRVAPAMDALLPAQGLVHLHAYLDLQRVPLHGIDFATLNADALKRARNVPNFPDGLAGVTIVSHHGETNYARRLSRRLQKEIVRQIGSEATGWAAFYWTNGATVSTLLNHVRWSEIPERIVGIILVGDAVAFPHDNIHSFRFIVPRGAAPDTQGVFVSSNPTDLGRLVMQRFETSSGVRPTLLRATTDGQARELLRRDGSRRILPFNLLMDKDRDTRPAN